MTLDLGAHGAVEDEDATLERFSEGHWNSLVESKKYGWNEPE
jgi:hypothetical protein